MNHSSNVRKYSFIVSHILFIAEGFFDADHLFFDRSSIDTFTYSLYHKETPLLKTIAEINALVYYFNPSVFLVENFGECENTVVRCETIEEAKIIEEALEKSYTSLGFQVIRVKPGSVEARVNEILKAIATQ